MSQMSALALHENMEREQFGGYNPDDSQLPEKCVCLDCGEMNEQWETQRICGECDDKRYSQEFDSNGISQNGLLLH